MYYVHCKNINNYFRSNGRQDGYEALESESFREGSLLQSLDETSKIRNGFADLFDQFQSFGDESQNNVTIWQKKMYLNSFLVFQLRFIDLIEENIIQKK